MILRVLLILVFSVVLSVPAKADEKPSSALIGGILEAYGAIQGVWHINLKCNLLSRRDRQVFEFHRNRVDEFVYANFTTQVFAPIRAAAEKVANDAKISKCDANAAALIPEGAGRAEYLSKRLPEAVPFSDAVYQDYLYRRVKNILAMLLTDQQCEMLPPKIKVKTTQAFQFTMKKMLPVLGEARFKDLIAAAKTQSEQSAAWNCGDAATNLYATRLADFRDFVATLQLNEG